MKRSRKRKLILWTTSMISLYGPRELENDRTANGCAKDLMATFAWVLPEILKDCKKQSPVLKKFRVKVEK